MSAEQLRESLSSGKHRALNQMVGQWSGETKTWFEEGDPVDVSPMTGVIRPLFDGRFVMHEYQGVFQGAPFEGITIFGYSQVTNAFESVWLDTFHTGTAMLFSKGNPGNELYNVKGSYTAPAPEPQEWGWRTEISQTSPDFLVLTAYNISPTGEETKATETVYHRR